MPRNLRLLVAREDKSALANMIWGQQLSQTGTSITFVKKSNEKIVKLKT